MKQTSLAPTSPRSRVLAILAALLMVASTVASASLASALPAATATQITITDVYTPSIDVPDTPGAGDPYIVRNVAFTVDFVLDAPLSTNKSTTLALTVLTGPDAGRVTVTYVVPAGATGGSIAGVVLPSAFNGVTLQLADTTRRSEVAPGTTTIDVLKNSLTAPATSKLTGWGGGGGVGKSCQPTSADPVCGDLLLPESNGVLSPQLLSQGACNTLDGRCGGNGSFLQALVDVDPNVYNQANPIEIVAKCDKTLCAGKGVGSYQVAVQIASGTGLATSPPCTQKNVITTGSFCTDYVSSRRDIAGDLLLVVLLEEDAKIIFR
jgi:hypothetical protein